ncbi:CopG family transcriptional regulator [Paremcibacter congregatus]|uniref:CopG family transcriptional regulator n=1 Tax=Paremcibacter congregatus TaxID=2043170 RepID=UPI003A92BE3C
MVTSQTKKHRIVSYLSYDLIRRAEALAAKTGASRSAVVEAALASFLSPEAADKREAVMVRRLDRLSRQYGRLERDMTILSEALGLFIHYELAIAPPVPVRDEAAIKAKGRERFDQFIARLGRRLSEGRSLVRTVVDELEATESDFFALDLDGSEGASGSETTPEADGSPGHPETRGDAP